MPGGPEHMSVTEVHSLPKTAELQQKDFDTLKTEYQALVAKEFTPQSDAMRQYQQLQQSMQQTVMGQLDEARSVGAPPQEISRLQQLMLQGVRIERDRETKEMVSMINAFTLEGLETYRQVMAQKLVESVDQQFDGDQFTMQKLADKLEEVGLDQDAFMINEVMKAFTRAKYAEATRERLKNLGPNDQGMALQLYLGNNILEQDSELAEKIARGDIKDADDFAEATYAGFKKFLEDNNVTAFTVEDEDAYENICESFNISNRLQTLRLSWNADEGVIANAKGDAERLKRLEAQGKTALERYNQLKAQISTLEDQIEEAEDADPPKTEEANRLKEHKKQLEEALQVEKERVEHFNTSQELLQNFQTQLNAEARRGDAFDNLAKDMEPGTFELPAAESNMIVRGARKGWDMIGELKDKVADFIGKPDRFRDLNATSIVKYLGIAMITLSGVIIGTRFGTRQFINAKNFLGRMVRLDFKGMGEALKQGLSDTGSALSSAIAPAAALGVGWAIFNPGKAEQGVRSALGSVGALSQNVLGVNVVNEIKSLGGEVADWFSLNVGPYARRGKEGVMSFFSDNWNSLKNFSSKQMQSVDIWAKSAGLSVEQLNKHFGVQTNLQDKIAQHFEDNMKQGGDVPGFTLSNEDFNKLIVWYQKRLQQNPANDAFKSLSVADLLEAGAIDQAEHDEISGELKSEAPSFAPDDQLSQQILEQADWYKQHYLST